MFGVTVSLRFLSVAGSPVHLNPVRVMFALVVKGITLVVTVVVVDITAIVAEGGAEDGDSEFSIGESLKLDPEMDVNGPPGFSVSSSTYNLDYGMMRDVKSIKSN